MEKQVKRFEVPFNFDWTYGVTIEKLRKDLDDLEKLGVKEIDIEAEENWGSASVTIEAFIEREETDEEFEKRVNEEKQRQEEIKRRELQQLEQLKSNTVCSITANVCVYTRYALTKISNYKQMLVGVSCIYVVIAS